MLDAIVSQKSDIGLHKVPEQSYQENLIQNDASTSNWMRQNTSPLDSKSVGDATGKLDLSTTNDDDDDDDCQLVEDPIPVTPSQRDDARTEAAVSNRATQQLQHSHQSVTYECPKCHEPCFSNLADLHKHQVRNGRSCMFVCERCSAAFCEVRSLQRHLRRVHSGLQLYSCMHPRCGLMFTSILRLEEHERACRSASTYQEESSIPNEQNAEPAEKSFENG